MIDLYTWTTPNGYKVSILLEELGVPYTVHNINIGEGDQFDPDYLKISPNNKMPAIVDQDGPGGQPYALFESGAIMMYLAEKHGKFWPQSHPDRYDTIKWLMWQMGGFGPMLGQAHHFRRYAPEPIQYAIDRYTNEAGRLYNVLNKRLGETEYLAGADYSIADMATFPWSRSIERQGHSFDDFPNVKRWFEAIDARPAVQRGLLVPDVKSESELSDKAREMMFGSAQYEKR